MMVIWCRVDRLNYNNDKTVTLLVTLCVLDLFAANELLEKTVGIITANLHRMFNKCIKLTWIFTVLNFSSIGGNCFSVY